MEAFSDLLTYLPITYPKKRKHNNKNIRMSQISNVYRWAYQPAKCESELQRTIKIV